MSRKLFYVILVLRLMLNANSLEAQTNVDSLWTTADSIQVDSQRINYLIELAWSFRTTNPDQGISLLKKLKEADFYKRIHSTPAEADFYLGDLYHMNGDFDLAETLFQEYYDYYKTQNLPEKLGPPQYKLSDIYWSMNALEKSLQAAILAQEAFRVVQSEEWIVLSTASEARVLNKLGRWEEAEQQLRAIISQIDGKDNLLTQIYSELSVIFDHNNMVDSALHYQELYKDMVMKTENLANQFIATYNVSLSLQNLKRYEEALKSFDESLELATKSGIPMLLPYGLISKGGLYTELDQPQKAIALFKEAEKSILLQDQVELIMQAKYEAYKKMGDGLAALKHLEAWKNYSDSLRNIEVTNRVNELQIKYESVKKENHITALSLQNTIQSYKVKVQQRGLFGLGGGLLLLGGLLFYTIKQRNKIKQQRDIISTSLAEKDILLKEIHHRVKNNLQLVSSLLSLQSRSLDNNTAVEALEESQNRVHSMALIHQYLYVDDRMAGVKMEKYIPSLCESTFEAYNIDANRVKLKLNIEELELDIETVVPLGLILNELITNACKYAFPQGRKGIVEVSLVEKNNQLFVTVQDDGVGMDSKLKKIGFGTSLINSFLKKMKAEIIRESKGGTSVTLVIENYHKIRGDSWASKSI